MNYLFALLFAKVHKLKSGDIIVLKTMPERNHQRQFARSLVNVLKKQLNIKTVVIVMDKPESLSTISPAETSILLEQLKEHLSSKQ